MDNYFVTIISRTVLAKYISGSFHVIVFIDKMLLLFLELKKKLCALTKPDGHYGVCNV